jgi:hypothetical protein
MGKRNENSPRRTSRATETDKLDALNAETTRSGKSADRIRRSIEASIEAKAKKRRNREVPASSAFRK